MLDELAVVNLGILSKAHIQPGAGLVVVSGETGTGKTLLLGALRLLLGGTAHRDQIGPHSDELSVEGRFVFDETEGVAARRVTRSRGRAYYDGAMVPAKVLRERLGAYVEIVGQHDALSLSETSVIRRLIDGAMAGDAAAIRDAYSEAYSAHRLLLERQAGLGGDQRSIEREIEILEYQAEDIDAANFESGDDETLAARAGRLRNAGAIVEALGGGLFALEEHGGAVDRLGEAADHLLRAARLDPTLSDLAHDSSELVDSATALAGELRRIAAELDHDGEDLDHVESRLGQLSDLRRKYGDTLEGVLGFGANARSQATELRQLLEGAAGLAEEIEKSCAALERAGATLTAERQATADAVAARVRTHLVDLGFSEPVVEFGFSAVAPAAHGADRITLLFASDAALKPSPVGRTASGGELSRLVLSVRLAAGANDAPVLAFDEIDAGLGGSTAYAMGMKLAALAKGRQVLCVTHLPQVAAFATEHIVVERTGATASVRNVEGDDRLVEITRMLAGLSGSASGRQHAAELLAAARRDS